MPLTSLTEYPPLMDTLSLYISDRGYLDKIADRYSSTAASVRLPGVGMAMDPGGHTHLSG